MNIELLDQQDLYPLDLTSLEAYAACIMQKVQELDPEINWQELSLVFTDDRIRELNHKWFDKNSVTDVISFAYPGTEATGEVIVNVQQAFEEGRLRESPSRELALYIAHGCHHLMGAEDDTPDKKMAMLTLENQWVAQALDHTFTSSFFL